MKPNTEILVAINGNHTALMIALRKILKPLVALLIRFKIVFPQFALLLKEVYVEVAEEKFRLSDKPQTHSRISLLTGVHRREVKRLREHLAVDQEIPGRIDVTARMIARWMSKAPYVDSQGEPLTLPLNSPSGPSFRQLVIDVCKQDFAMGVIFDEWLDLGIISQQQQQVTLNKKGFIGKKDLEEKLFFLGHNVGDHLSAIEFNLNHDLDLFFDRCVYYDSLCKDSVEAVEALIEKKGMETLIEVNNLVIRLRKADQKRACAHHRINVGLYAYHYDESLKNKRN
jgi:hypothetical protein